ncbi:MAG: Sec-independent protein translocase protein TatB [Burkholderiaceae bacterium]|nr:Sec-independent protein translocase protein TatB [Pseudomonadota bacterium]MDA0869693.1 Sec-independent protein translocase protein TatB [Pseudomonadota bacterium]NBR81097.1 Sec-independent protein translocase subunit TatB [Candidatus Fonsibacter lacus]
MIDLGISKLALIGAVALVVIGPERLPRVARTVGALLGKAQRYVSDVKAEVNRSMELEELRKMKDGVENSLKEAGDAMNETAEDFENAWDEAAQAYRMTDADRPSTYPQYRHPKKNWRLKRTALPTWYKARSGRRAQVQSGAARVARHRPRPGVSPKV